MEKKESLKELKDKLTDFQSYLKGSIKELKEELEKFINGDVKRIGIDDQLQILKLQN